VIIVLRVVAKRVSLLPEGYDDEEEDNESENDSEECAVPPL
jgi:hypothetical protein